MAARKTCLVGFTLILAVAGCLAPSTDCKEAECPADPSMSAEFITWGPGVPLPPLPVSEAGRSLRMEGCNGLVAMISVSGEQAEDFIPPGFQNNGLVPLTARLLLLAYECDRATVEGEIVEPYRQVLLALEAEPENQTWVSERGPSRVLLDWFVDSALVAERLQKLGTGAEASEIRVDRVDLDGSSTVSWAISSANASVEFRYATVRERTVASNSTSFIWYGPNPYLRSTWRIAYEIGNPVAGGGPITFGGESRTSQLVGAQASGWEGQPHEVASNEITIDPMLFEAN